MNPLVEKTVIELGYESIDTFFHQKLIEGVQQKIDKFTKEVVEFEKKYNMKFPQFQKEYLLKEGEEAFEKDDDGMGMECKGNSRIKQKIGTVKECKIYSYDTMTSSNPMKFYKTKSLKLVENLKSK